MKRNFTVRQGALDGVEAFLSVAQHRSFRRAAAQLGVTPSAVSRPRTPDDLRRHACLRWRRSDGALAPWSFVEDGRTLDIAVSGPLIAHDLPTLLGAACEGMGLAQLPEPVAARALKAGTLMQTLESFAPLMPGVCLCFPSRRQIMPKLRAFIDHVKRTLAHQEQGCAQTEPARGAPRKASRRPTR